MISPYKQQVKLLRDSFFAALGEEGARLVDINTVDGFQGREKDIILFSCVRRVTSGELCQARCSFISHLGLRGQQLTLLHNAS